ncbi:SubName: Full=Uncharacterized protein {ECO:0000313/EMBL:CCA70185.1} [Serendipita indica DSM 11827]|nr:SubName: Full=Uncharacterized protein {ECO:0000313/EMBL:CCA70185.1} [Serendipita indica DSM 11827]
MIILWLFPLLVASHPLYHHSRSEDNLFPYTHYSQYQISDGTGGDAYERASQLILEPLLSSNANLSSTPFAVYERLDLMWEAVDYAHAVLFPQEIQAARVHQDQFHYEALQVGMTKNDVLKRLIHNVIYQIKAAKDASEGLEMDETLLDQFE